MMIALPNLDGTFTCTLFWPFDGPHGFNQLSKPEQVRSYFAEQFPDVPPLMPNLAEEYFANPTGSLVTVRCRPWHVSDRVVLIGDAAHAVVPFLGQGMNAAFEDCTVLSECLERHGPRGEAAFRAFEVERKPHSDVLADLCVQNFIEMRDKVGSARFRLWKKFDILLGKLFPRWYVPLYTMVSFTRIPYAEAVWRAHWQNRQVVGIALVIGTLLIAFIAWSVVPLLK
jgi:kynurenine 3-monooxygenase